MIVNVDALKLFMPYIKDKYNIPCSNSITNIYFNCTNSNKFGIRYLYSDTDYFKNIENSLMSRYELIDDTFDSIILLIDKDKILEESFNSYLEGNYSKINKEVIVSYFSSFNSTNELRKDIIFKVLTKSKLLRKEIEEYLNVKLPLDAELGNLPDPVLFNFDNSINDF